MVRAIVALGISAAVLGCRDERAKPPVTAPVAPATTRPPVSTFGQPIDVRETVSLVDITKTPASYKGKAVATQGTVTRVCQERGCWMAIKDDSSTATVRMHGHGFFVPTDAAGKHARVEGTVVLVKDGKECDDLEALDAKLELDATGVELN
jgi:hypothetical protein